MEKLWNLIFWMPWPPPRWVVALALLVVTLAAAMLMFAIG
jgi:hypothetical protein